VLNPLDIPILEAKPRRELAYTITIRRLSTAVDDGCNYYRIEIGGSFALEALIDVRARIAVDNGGDCRIELRRDDDGQYLAIAHPRNLTSKQIQRAIANFTPEQYQAGLAAMSLRDGFRALGFTNPAEVEDIEEVFEMVANLRKEKMPTTLGDISSTRRSYDQPQIGPVNMTYIKIILGATGRELT